VYDRKTIRRRRAVLGLLVLSSLVLLTASFGSSGAGGGIGAVAAKAVGKAPDQLINDDLRRFKALLETGVLARSETSPEGPSSHRQIFHKRQPAQPLGKDT